jgi:hypothetical protein
MHQPHKVHLVFYYPRNYFIGLHHLHKGVKSVTECKSRQSIRYIQVIHGCSLLYGYVTCHCISSAVISHRQAVFFHIDDKDAVKFQALERKLEVRGEEKKEGSMDGSKYVSSKGRK